jgi:hypothetical protein
MKKYNVKKLIYTIKKRIYQFVKYTNKIIKT